MRDGKPNDHQPLQDASIQSADTKTSGGGKQPGMSGGALAGVAAFKRTADGGLAANANNNRFAGFLQERANITYILPGTVLYYLPDWFLWVSHSS